MFAQEYIHQNIWDAVIWGCISIRGPGVCAIVEERLRAPVYVRILREKMLPSVTQVFGERNFIFQDDNCRVHRARVVREFLDEQGCVLYRGLFEMTITDCPGFHVPHCTYIHRYVIKIKYEYLPESFVKDFRCALYTLWQSKKLVSNNEKSPTLHKSSNLIS
jgi:hypothetical protein